MFRAFVLFLASFLALAPATGRAAGDLVMSVSLDYDQERDHVAIQTVFNDLSAHLSTALGQRVKMVMSQNAERVGERIRTGSFAIVLAPAQLVGLAMRNGYTPVARTEQNTRVVVLAKRASGIRSLSQARGKRLALPHMESLVSYMLKGELNARGLSANSHFGRVNYMNKYGAVLYAMEIGQADLVAVKEQAAREWLSGHPDTTIIESLPETPAAGVAVNDTLDEALKSRIRSVFTQLGAELEGKLKRARLSNFEPADTADFEYVSTRGYYTPETLTGVTIVTAEEVRKMMQNKTPLYDVRPESHYRQEHIPGSINVPYELNRPKDPDFDDSVDRFDLARLPKDKNAPMIFQCNGAECWYSYKAARYMARRGHTRVYWFRTGLPAWKAAGYPTKRGA